MSDWQNDWLYKWIFKRVAEDWNEVHTAEEAPERFAVVEYASSGSTEPQFVGPIDRMWFYDEHGLRLATEIEKQEFANQRRRLLALIEGESSLHSEELAALYPQTLTPSGRFNRQACIGFQIGGDRRRFSLSEDFGPLYGRSWLYEVTGEGESAQFRGRLLSIS